MHIFDQFKHNMMFLSKVTQYFNSPSFLGISTVSAVLFTLLLHYVIAGVNYIIFHIADFWKDCTDFPNSTIQKRSTGRSPVEGHVGVKNGSSHCFGASVVTDCTQADGARLSTQTAALLLYISLHLQPDNMEGGRFRQGVLAR